MSEISLKDFLLLLEYLCDRYGGNVPKWILYSELRRREIMKKDADACIRELLAHEKIKMKMYSISVV
jgi:hypothetical protein